LPGERDNARNNARCMQARKATTAWMDNIKMWTELSMEESVRMTEDRDKWRKYVHRSRTAKEQNRIHIYSGKNRKTNMRQ